MFSQCKKTFIFTHKLFEESWIINSTKVCCQTIEQQSLNGWPFTTQILENSMVFSRSWWIDLAEAMINAFNRGIVS